MGYTTEFYGRLMVEPPFNESEINYIEKFNMTRRMKRELGPYFVDGTGDYGQGDDSDVLDHNNPPEDQPGLWCKWLSTADGKFIEWDGNEKFYDSMEWMEYLIDNFVKSEALAIGCPGFENFTFDHVVNGEIEAQGEDSDDHWQLVVRDNIVSKEVI